MTRTFEAILMIAGVTAIFSVLIITSAPVAEAQEPFIGQINHFGFGFAPRGWSFCDGQLLSISSNTALFSLLGTTFGGDGRTTFALPEARGRVMIHPGTGPGLTDYKWGQKGGTETVTLTPAQIPSLKLNAVGAPGDTDDPEGNLLAEGDSYPHFKRMVRTYSTQTTPLVIMDAASIGDTSVAPHKNIQPYLGIHCNIALVGIYPSRN